MSDCTDTVETRVTISIEDYPLPVAEDARTRAQEALKDAVRGLLHWHADLSRITTRTGHHYVQISDDCLRCGGTLALREYTTATTGRLRKPAVPMLPSATGEVEQSTGSSTSKAGPSSMRPALSPMVI